MEREVEQISSTGLSAVMLMFMVGTPLTVPLAAVAGHDAWISILFSMILSSGIVWVYTHLCQLYPGKSLIEIGGELFGAWVGRLPRTMLCMVQLSPRISCVARVC